MKMPAATPEVAVRQLEIERINMNLTMNQYLEQQIWGRGQRSKKKKEKPEVEAEEEEEEGSEGEGGH